MRGKGLVMFFALALAQREFVAEAGDPAVLNRALALSADGSVLLREKRYAEAEVAFRSAIRACADPG